MSTPTPSAARPGTRFVFDRCLGAGGFGEVYLARMITSGGLSRDVAVKLLLASIDAGAVARLRDEARLLAALHHPAILQVYDLVDIEGRPALVTEFVDGADVSTLVAEGGALPPRVAVEVVGAVAGALQAALVSPSPVDRVPLGLVHRDIKPGNIRVARTGAVKLLDFGIAVASGLAREARTGTGLVVGTLGYLAPERLAEPEVRPPSDVYALGCVLFEALSGNRLFGGLSQSQQLKLVMSADHHDRHVHERLAAAGLPAELTSLVRRLVSFDAADRPDTHALELACDELAPQLAGPTLKRWARDRAWREPEPVNGPLRGRTIEVSGSLDAARSGFTVGTAPPPDAPRPGPPSRPQPAPAPRGRGVGATLAVFGGLFAAGGAAVVVVAVVFLGGLAWVASLGTDEPVATDGALPEPEPPVEGGDVSGEDRPDAPSPAKAEVGRKGSAAPVRDERAPEPMPEPAPVLPDPEPAGETLTLQGGLTLPVPAGWRGQAADGTRAVLVTPDGNNLLIAALQDIGGSSVQAELSNTIDAGDGILLHPTGTPRAELGGHSNEFSVTGSATAVRASVIARVLPDGRALAVIAIGSVDTYGTLLDGQRAVFRGARAGRSAVSQAGAGSWTSELAGRYLVKIFNGNGYSERHELWLCSDGSFAYAMDGGGFTSGVASGGFASNLQGAWRATGAATGAGTLTLDATDGTRIEYTARPGNDGIYLNGERWMRGDNTRCR